MRSWMHPVVTTLLALAPALVSVLASREARAEGCVPGAQISCPCLNGSQGVQVCSDGGNRYGACQCAEKNSSPEAAPAPEASPESPKGSIHLATVSSPEGPPAPPAPSKGPAAGATNGAGSGGSLAPSTEATPPVPQRSRTAAVETRPTRSQEALNIGLGLTIFGALAFPVGGLWFLSQASDGGSNDGCLNPPGRDLCAGAATVFGLGTVALAVGVPLLVINLTRPAPTIATAAAAIAPAWQPAVFVGRSNVRVVWAF
jgi:hypothetical protein